MGVKVTCRDCGDVSLSGFNGVKKIQLQHNIDDDTWTYIFRCPVCQMIEVKIPLSEQVDVLLAAGVLCREWRYPAELDERTRSGNQSRISHDDVLDFHFALASIFGSCVAGDPELDDCRQGVARQLGAES